MPKSEPSKAVKQAEEALEKQELALKTAELAKKQREQEEPPSPLAKLKEDAEARKSITEAHQLSAEAQQKEWSALVPDLGNVTDKPLKTEGNTPILGPALTRQATAVAAKGVASQVCAGIGERDLDSARILVTGDAELATSDATYFEVLNSLESLVSASQKLMDDIDPTKAPLGEGPEETAGGEAMTFTSLFAAPVVPIAKALATALPGILSLFTPQRTLSTSVVTADSFAAAAVVAGDLRGGKEKKPGVSHDDFRLLPATGKVQDEVAALTVKREELIALKLKLEDEKAAQSDKPITVAESTSRIAQIDSAISVIDSFTTLVRKIPDGAKYSPLAAAILREQLHSSGDGDEGKAWFTHVLLVKAESGSAQQLIDDRALWFKDKFTTIVTSTVTYMLIETATGGVLAAGSIGGQAEVSGTVGREIEVAKTKVIESAS